MRKLFSLLLLVLLVITPLCAQSAMAQTGEEYLASMGAKPVDASRVSFKGPITLKVSTSTEGDADYTVTIKHTETDWIGVIGEMAMNGPRLMVNLMQPYGIIVTPPAGTVAYEIANVKLGNGGNPETLPTYEACFEKAAADAFNNFSAGWDTLDDGVIVTDGTMIGSYTPSTNIYQSNLSHWLGFVHNLSLFAWEDAQGNKTYEYLTHSIQIDNPNPFTVKFPELSTADMIPAANLSDSQKAQITIDAVTNNVSYHLESAVALSGVSEIKTGVRFPFEAQDDWTCRVTGNTGMQQTYTAAQLEAGIPLSLPAQEGEVSSDTLNMVWYDGNNNFKTARSLTVSITCGDPTPWPTRVSGWTPVPQSRMKTELVNKYDGLDFTYTEKRNGGNWGVLDVAVDSDKLPDNKPLSNATYNAYIIPPDGAVSFAFYWCSPGMPNPLPAHMDYDNIYDYSSGNPESVEVEIASSRRLKVADLLTANGLPLFWDDTKFMSAGTLNLGDETITLYSANNASISPYRGTYRLIYWYDENGNQLTQNGKPLKEYYIIDRSSPVVTRSTAAADTLESLRKQDARYPRLRIQQGGSDGQTYYFNFHVVPQSNAGENAADNAKRLCYNLYITDEDGNVLTDSQVRGLGKVSVYLPYPEGITFKTVEDYIISVDHLQEYSGEYSVVETFDGNTLEFTEDGICFTATSFSPYMLSWEFDHVLTTTASGNVITQTCSCGEQATATVSIAPSFIEGEKVEAVVSASANWQGAVPAVTYYDKDGKALSAAPTAVGSYTAAIEMDGKRAFADFIIDAKPHILTVTGAGDTLTQTCSCDDQATATVSAKETYAEGEKVEATVSFAGSWQGVKPAVSYYTTDGKALTKAPTAPGKYSAVIESDGARAEVFFSIVAAPQSVLPQTGDPSLPLLLLAVTALCALCAMQLLRRKHA